ncbi:MAG: hypothetical protein R3F54_32365 [Alphaproteobacteria bacterium]
MADLVLGKVSYRRLVDRPAGETVPITLKQTNEDEGDAQTGPGEAGDPLRFRQHRVAHMCDGSAGEQPPPSLRTLITHLASVPD